MGVGILIVTHGSIGQAILDIATKIIGSAPMPVKAIDIDMNANSDTLLTTITKAIKDINTGDGVLILTDLFGATPSNIASTTDIQDCIVVAGINLPMLIRLMNYHSLPLYELSDKAVDGGRDGILAYYLNKDRNYAANKD